MASFGTSIRVSLLASTVCLMPLLTMSCASRDPNTPTLNVWCETNHLTLPKDDAEQAAWSPETKRAIVKQNAYGLALCGESWR